MDNILEGDLGFSWRHQMTFRSSRWNIIVKNIDYWAVRNGKDGKHSYEIYDLHYPPQLRHVFGTTLQGIAQDFR